MRMYDIINQKRFGQQLDPAQIEYFITGYTNGTIPDYQVSALLMAICVNGMTDTETAILTQCMASSGDTLDLSHFGESTVDKHSTGGVGDKTTLIVAPIVASLGCTVAKLSGRGLGHTGGTLDKLESVKGYRTDLTPDEFMSVASECGICVSGAGKNLVPADKKLYALRDVTATVSSIPLIVSSIMSKKLAGGSKSIVLDVKMGSGAFMKNEKDAFELARRMVSIGTLSGRRVSAVVTDMDRPLGKTIGNFIEASEAYQLLCDSKNSDKNLLSVCETLSAQMVSLSKGMAYDDALSEVKRVLADGSARDRFERWITLQGGDVTLLKSDSDYCRPRYTLEVCAPCDGYISSADTESLGIAAMMLGAGRATKEDIIDFSAGITLYANVGDGVCKGMPIASLRSDTVSDLIPAQQRFLDSLSFSRVRPASQQAVLGIVNA